MRIISVGSIYDPVQAIMVDRLKVYFRYIVFFENFFDVLCDYHRLVISTTCS